MLTIAAVALTTLARFSLSAPVERANSGPQKGLGYNNAALLSGWTGKISWVSNWEQDNDGVPSGLNFYPTLWNGDPQRTISWDATAKAALARGDNVFFGFNEPVMSLCPNATPPPPQFQACMEPGDAAQTWIQYMSPYAAKGATLVSPSVPQGDEGIEWWMAFFKACPQDKCHIDAINLHWYEKSSNIEYFKQYITDAYNNDTFTKYTNEDGTSGRRKVWLTEFAPTDGTEQEQATFFQTVTQWMDSQSFIAGYSAFWAESLSSSSGPNTIGAGYAST